MELRSSGKFVILIARYALAPGFKLPDDNGMELRSSGKFVILIARYALAPGVIPFR